jgi:hypothetical protein
MYHKKKNIGEICNSMCTYMLQEQLEEWDLYMNAALVQ